MSIAVKDRRSVPEALERPAELSFKKAAEFDSANGQMLAVDEHEGIVTAVVSVTGIEDEVADIIEPGAYAATLKKRRPKVCWAHSWEHPIGRVLDIEELLPGDKRLPKRTRDGQAWPTEAGALVATMQFNMRSTAGKEAFAAVVFYSETGECEYSIGYQVPSGKATRDGKGVRHIKALELFELSVVLFGAHTMTGTLSIKEAYQAAMERKSTGAVEGKGIDEGIDRAALQAKGLDDDRSDDDDGGDSLDPDDADDPPDFSDGVMIAIYPDPAAADAVAEQIAGPDKVLDRDELHVTLAFLGNIHEVDMESQQIVRVVTEAIEGMPSLEGEIAGIGMFPDNGDGSPTWAPVDVPGLGLLREAIVEALGESVRTDHGFTPHMTLGYDIGLVDPITPVPITVSGVRVVYGNQQFDISLDRPVEGESKTREAKDGEGAAVSAPADVGVESGDSSVAAVEGGEGVSTTTGIIEVCPGCENPVRFDTMNGWQALDGSYSHEADGTHGDHLDAIEGDDLDGAAAIADLLDSMTDADWDILIAEALDAETITTEDDVKARFGADIDGKAITPGGRVGDDSPLGTPGNRENWVDKAGGLPRYIRMVANALKRKGMSTSRAIATAVNTIKRWAANASGKVSAKVQAAAARALAEWEAKKKVGDARKAMAYDPALDLPRETKADPTVASGGMFPYLAGSMEERIAIVTRSVVTALQGDLISEERERYEWDHVNVRGTWDDRVVAERVKWGVENETEAYQMAYALLEDGDVDLGDPEPLRLHIVAVTEDGEATDDYSVADDEGLIASVERMAFTIKRAHADHLEGKAGRVLSGRNERALREAVTRLIDVLAAAGVEIAVDDDDHRRQTVASADADEDTRREMDQDVDVETTSPSANQRRKSADETVDARTMAETIAHFRALSSTS